MKGGVDDGFLVFGAYLLGLFGVLIFWGVCYTLGFLV